MELSEHEGGVRLMVSDASHIPHFKVLEDFNEVSEIPDEYRTRCMLLDAAANSYGRAWIGMDTRVINSYGRVVYHILTYK